jgi:hypothetical protein
LGKPILDCYFKEFVTLMPQTRVNAVGYRMCSLLPSGAGVRNNAGKRAYVATHLSQIEYRVIALAGRDEAKDFERRELWSRREQGRHCSNFRRIPRPVG